MKTASEMTYTVSGGALNSTQTKLLAALRTQYAHCGAGSMQLSGVCLSVCPTAAAALLLYSVPTSLDKFQK